MGRGNGPCGVPPRPCAGHRCLGYGCPPAAEAGEAVHEYVGTGGELIQAAVSPTSSTPVQSPPAAQGRESPDKDAAATSASASSAAINPKDGSASSQSSAVVGKEGSAVPAKNASTKENGASLTAASAKLVLSL